MDLNQNYWGGQVNHTAPEDGATDMPKEDRAQRVVTQADRIRARVAVSRGEAELYLIQMPPVDFSMLELGLAGDIYNLVYDGEVYGYTNNPKIFKAKK